jgi:murein L,D-transpeptidase YcbB/YkuD
MRLLKKGDSGPEVRNLQKILKITMDGEFGPVTESAVKRFQMNYDLMIDGIVGRETWQMLIVHGGKVEEVDLDCDTDFINTNYGQKIERYYLP